MSAPEEGQATTHDEGRPEPHRTNLAQRLNWLRAGVLGANDGIVSTAAVVVGVAGASSSSTGAIATAGAAAAVGGAVSMALGEYVSVSSQRDTEHALIEKERRELVEDPDGELDELTRLYTAQGISPATARQAAVELTERDALAAHLRAELGIDQGDVVSPWHAAAASFISFSIGAVLPLLAILLPGPNVRVLITFVVTLVALALTGYVAAWIGAAARGRASLRVVIGGALALAATFFVGLLFGTTGVAG